MEGRRKKNIPANVGAQRVQIVTLCVCVFWFLSPLDKQLQQAILHLPTLELSIETAQTKKWKKQKTQQKKNINQTTTATRKKSKRRQTLEQMSILSPAVTSNNSRCLFFFFPSRQFELLPDIYFFSLSLSLFSLVKDCVAVQKENYYYYYYYFVFLCIYRLFHNLKFEKGVLKKNKNKIELMGRTVASVAV